MLPEGYFGGDLTKVHRCLALLPKRIRWREKEDQDICFSSGLLLCRRRASIPGLAYLSILALPSPFPASFPAGGPLSAEMAILDMRSTSSGSLSLCFLWRCEPRGGGPLAPGTPWNDQARIGSPQTLTNGPTK